MVDTIRTLSALQTLLADNASGDISAQDIRDFLVSVYPRGPELTGSDDDSFSDGATTGWTEILPSGAHTITEADRTLSVLPTGQNASDLAGISKSVALSTGDSIQTSVRIMSTNANFAMAALVIGDGNAQTDNIVAGFLQFQSSNVYLTVTRGGTWETVGSDIQISANDPMHADIGISLGEIHLRLTYVSANTFRFEISPDGVSWWDVGMSDSARTITPSSVGLGWTVWGGSTEPVISFGYFKVNS